MAAPVTVHGRNWMHDFADYYEITFVNKTNPVVMSWSLVGEAWKAWMIVMSYFIFINYIGPAFMRRRKPFELRWLMVPYNILLVLFNSYLFIQFAISSWKGGIKVQCSTFDYSFDSKKYPELFRLAEVTWYFYISKYVELLDTVIFVLRKKERQLSRLHIVHHTTVPIFVLYLLRSEPGGYNVFFPLANSFVHCIMYTYYGVSACGEDVTIHLKYKKYVTITQLIQFILVLCHFFSRPFFGCNLTRIAYGNLVIAGFFFVLFINFYINEYIKGRNEEVKQKDGIKQNGYKTS